MSGKRAELPILGHGAVVAVAQCLELGAGLALAALIARHLGAPALGRFTVAMAVLMTANTFLDLGASALLTREVARCPARARALLSEQLRLKGGLLLLAALAVLTAITLLVLVPASLEEIAGMLLVGKGIVFAGVLFLAASAANISVTAALRGLQRFRPLVVSAAPASILQVFGGWLCLARGGDVTSVLWIMAGAQWLRLILLKTGLPRSDRDVTPAAAGDTRSAVSLLRKVAPFAGVVLVGVAYLKSDVYLLSLLSGAAMTGFYAASIKVIELLKLLPGAYLTALYPEMARREDPFLVPRNDRRRALGLVSAGAALSVLLGAPWLVPAVYGPQMSPSVVPLQVLALGLMPAVANNAMLLELYAAGQERSVLRCLGTALALNVTMNSLLIPSLGATGAALSLTASEWALAGLYRHARSARELVEIPAVVEAR